MPQNILSQETSPYLLQHAENPVHWQPWSAEALAEARTANKPVLLSIGYAACHWCHVMAHESFEDEAIARLMNELFVNIKVDREERPDLDAIYQSALAMTGQPGGWPLTMFLTPDGAPFWGGTYFPPTARFGRPGFPEVLNAVAETYRSAPEKVSQNVEALRRGLDRLAQNPSGDGLPEAIVETAADRIVREVDTIYGGIGGAPKFPQVSIFRLLWRAYKHTGDQRYRAAVQLTLSRMCQGGIYDHLGGGFARYSVDAEWLAPHFEKMLYDNAQLLDLLSEVWQETRLRLFEARARETVGWLLREMLAPDGGFAATLDADSEGEEGKFYVWSEAELADVLGGDLDVFRSAYEVSADGNWEGKIILRRPSQADIAAPETEATLAGLRDRLLARRAGRVRPGWDDKVLADWNGLMVAALANASLVFDEPAWCDAAAAAFAFVRDRMTVDGRLRHAYRSGQARHTATLDDYANMARAALSLFEATGDAAYIDQARRWADDVHTHYWDPERGGYFFTADDAETLIVRTKSAYDSAVPSGNGTMVGVLATLFHLTGDAVYHDRASAVVSAFSGEIERDAFPMTALLNAAALLDRGIQVVVVGDRADPATRALTRIVLDRSMPDRLLTVVAPGASLPDGHPAAGKAALDGRPTAYVCFGMTCRPPVTDPGALAKALDAGATAGDR